MTLIRSLFDEAVAAPPPSRLTAEAVLGASRVRRRRRTATMATLIAAGLALAAAAASLSAGGRAVAPANPLPPGSLVWAGRGDADRLYVLKDLCGVNPYLDPQGERRPEGLSSNEPCRELLASLDGGQTWLSRGAMVASELQIIDPLTLIRIVPMSPHPTEAGTRSGYPSELSTDAGATWTVMPADGPRINTVPTGGALLGLNRTPKVFDPEQGRLRPLNRPPDLLEARYVSTTGSAIWFSGFDPPSRRPAIAVSHDGGATWTERVLPNTDAAFEDVTLTEGPDAGRVVRNVYGAAAWKILSRDGVTAYTFLPGTRPPSSSTPSLPPTDDGGWQQLFQTVDGGVTWQEQVGAGAPNSRNQWITDDGRIVCYFDRRLDGTAGATFAVTSDGRTYAVTPLAGLPESVLNVAERAAFGAHAMYTSDDGWTWHQVYPA